ncbi:MAG: glycosyltransferase family 39 protein [Anaerolineae bacterium]|nr:glycosyltransferase family 39 protein [Anaerolineae bacterium]
MQTDLNQTTSKRPLLRRLYPVAFLLGGAALLTLFIIGTFLPFAQYTKALKVLIAVIVMTGCFGLLVWLWKHLIQPNRAEIKAHVLYHGTAAILQALLLLSLLHAYSPVVPIALSFTLTTDTPLAFSHAALEQSFGRQHILNPAHYSYDGEWNFHDGISWHMGFENGTVRYDEMMTVSNPVRLQFSFQPLDTPAVVEINLNGTTETFEIHAGESTGEGSGFSTQFIPWPTYSTLYRVWLIAYPIARGMVIAVYFWLTSVAIRSKTRLRSEIILRSLAGFLYAYLFFISIHFQNELANVFNGNLLLFAAAVLIMTGGPLGITRLLRRHPHLQPWLLLAVGLLAVVLRVYWIRMVPTAQVSDFGRFHTWALQLAAGTPNLEMDRYATFTRLVSLLYRISPTAAIVQGANIGLSLLSMLGIYWIGRETGQATAGVVGAYLFALFPSQISMVGLVNTDIPSVTLLVLTAAMLVSCLRRRQWRWLWAAALFFAVAFSIRAPLLMYAPILLLPLLFDPPRNWRRVGLYAASLIVPFLVGLAAVNAIIAPAVVEGMVVEEGKNVIWPLLNGTNIAARGRNNDPDHQLILSWSAEEAWQKGLPMVAERIFSQPVAYYNLLKVKYSHQFANSAYGADLAFLDEDMNFQTFQTGWPYPTQEVRRGFALFSQYSYWCVLGAAMLLAWTWRREDASITGLNLVMLVCALGAYAFFEVQPRYQRPVIPFVILAAALVYTRAFGGRSITQPDKRQP